MDMPYLLDALRRSRRLIVLVVVVCTGAAVLQTQLTEPRYESEAQLFVAAADREFSLQRAPSYAALATSQSVTRPVIRSLALPDTPTELGRRLSASTPPDTVLINLTVEDNDPGRAQRTGRAVAERLIKLVEQLERTNQGRLPRVRMSVSSPASLASEPVSPNAPVNLAAGIVFGLMLGALAAIVRRRLDRRISTPADLPNEPGHGVLAVVPIDEAAGTLPAVGLRVASPERAEALRRLRTNLRHLDPDRPARTIVVCSTQPGEGASTTAVGLALAMAEGGSDVVLVEADLRRPSLTDQLTLRRNQGLAGHLAAGTPVDGLLQPWSAGHVGGTLRVLVAGAVAPDPSELLSSRRMGELLDDLSSRCDVVLIDAPPLLSATDAAVLAGEADAVLLVVRMGRVTRPELDDALDILALARAHVLGFVANAVAPGVGDDGRPGYPANRDSAAPSPAHASKPPPAAPIASRQRTPRVPAPPRTRS